MGRARRSQNLVTSFTYLRCESRLKCPNCGLIVDRQFIGAHNIWMRGSGVTPSGEKANDILPNDPGGESRLMPPKALRSQVLMNAHDG